MSSILKAWGGKRKKIFVLFDICAVGIVWDMTVKTGSTCGFVPCIFVIVFFVLEQFKHLVRRKNKTKTVIALTGGIFVFILSMYVSDWTLHSNILNKEVIVGEIDMEEKSSLPVRSVTMYRRLLLKRYRKTVSLKNCLRADPSAVF